MNKQMLIDYIESEAGISKVDAIKALDAMLMGITKGLKEYGKVSINGFCTFVLKEKSERVGRNPRTGENVLIPARKTVGMKLGSKLKENLNK